MTHKQMTAFIRKSLAALGVPVNVRMVTTCGVKGIHVSGKTFDTKFTCEQCLLIAQIAKANGLTKARGLSIDLNVEMQLTGQNEKRFEFHA